jgi:hypothetical protein
MSKPPNVAVVQVVNLDTIVFPSQEDTPSFVAKGMFLLLLNMTLAGTIVGSRWIPGTLRIHESLKTRPLFRVAPCD